jgi:hypothetical protein
MKPKYFTIRRIWHNTFNVGMGVGWADDDNSFCLIFQLGLWAMIIGPHEESHSE